MRGNDVVIFWQLSQFEILARTYGNRQARLKKSLTDEQIELKEQREK
jgi:hypothetical protein